MVTFKIHAIETAPEGSKEIFEEAQKQNGFISNLYKIMAESHEVLKAYRQMNELFNATSLNSIEKNFVWLTVLPQQLPFLHDHSFYGWENVQTV